MPNPLEIDETHGNLIGPQRTPSFVVLVHRLDRRSDAAVHMKTFSQLNSLLQSQTGQLGLSQKCLFSSPPANKLQGTSCTLQQDIALPDPFACLQDDYRAWELPHRDAPPPVAPRVSVPFDAETSYHDTYHAHPLEAPTRHHAEPWKGMPYKVSCTVLKHLHF